ncbi:lipoprotein-releasing system permease protein [Aliiroseovarius halocynthiae]|uniref:Lipoprotein-releasing ABC transporter permease subunit n=1 Tax=Aliiroseovarius halocynthiae TaxID=985055 RepID=A0A545SXW9_9RHOB|nr:lipoprotein-releasing ABC transporter permease subunit [Aliiroseovarius halocynthiae]TQV69816.1 lipoprotein-releasing ABC transporter permease subunit [Aliiroseovarius halocynthiae]SMR81702.1 lipoprotein-releasing system permease protein [Aliiroseovarius halocynthiae]
MPKRTAPFSRFEWQIAWRYLRARRAEGGVSTMTWISLIGITLAVAALIITLAVRTGFRDEFVDTILGANAHVEVFAQSRVTANGGLDRTIQNYEDWADRIMTVPGVVRAAPLIKGQIMANRGQYNAGVEVFGISQEDIMTIPRIAEPESSAGDLADFERGISIGSGVAAELNVGIGDKIKIISPNGVKTAFGTSPRVNAYEVTYIFTAGRWDIDRTRVYLPIAEAQSFFNREGLADEIEVMVDDPEGIDDLLLPIMEAVEDPSGVWTWRDRSGAFLRALDMEDNVMFIILSVLVLIASMNITSGLIMLVKNKGRDIGILRTMGLTEGSILRVFFLCGSLTGVVGTIAGVILGCLFALNIDSVFSLVNYVSGGGVWDPSIRGIYHLPAKLEFWDVASAVGLSLTLSFVVTLFPARKAARMNPVEALRYE